MNMYIYFIHGNLQFIHGSLISTFSKNTTVNTYIVQLSCQTCSSQINNRHASHNHVLTHNEIFIDIFLLTSEYCYKYQKLNHWENMYAAYM